MLQFEQTFHAGRALEIMKSISTFMRMERQRRDNVELGNQVDSEYKASYFDAAHALECSMDIEFRALKAKNRPDRRKRRVFD